MLKLPQLSSRQVDGLNIALMFISLVLAFILPFELFLFSYAILGPLHYLTEISWLHKKNYYVPGRKDFWVFLVASLLMGVLITLSNYWSTWFGNGERTEIGLEDWGANMIFAIFFVAFIFVVFKKTRQRAVTFVALGILLVGVNFESRSKCVGAKDMETGEITQTLCSDDKKAINAFVEENGIVKDGKYENIYNLNLPKFPFIFYFFTAFLPTLVHVFLFTSFFMLFGAIKSHSRLGYIAVGFHFICAAIALFLPGDIIPYTISEWGRKSYDVSFLNLNQVIFQEFHLGSSDPENIYGSNIGIALTRFIAFAYTYHYLNWFSKTSIIQWHKMPVLNLSVVIVLWIASIVLYVRDYELGLMALFFLSFLHVFMEFPLNFQSIIGIGRAMFRKRSSGSSVKVQPKTA